ncbi:hypothetical protein F5B20DRAFT_6841 [Whalleya microplaca]|nr:hypothetical protein F5B20DRAFT_6841 [Whalleya microplaca]
MQELVTMAARQRTELLCPDWVVNPSSALHCCKNEGWFCEYTPFQSVATDIFGHEIQVTGIGTVELAVKHSPNISGRRSHAIFRLVNVLHIPSAPANVIGGPIFFEEGMSLKLNRHNLDGAINDSQGIRMAYLLRTCGLFTVKLSGPPLNPQVGPSELKPDAGYMLHVMWPKSECLRWEAFQASQDPRYIIIRSSPAVIRTTRTGAGKPQASSEPPSTLIEEKWNKGYFGSAYDFLKGHWTKVFGEEEHDEGHAIAHAHVEEKDEFSDDEYSDDEYSDDEYSDDEYSDDEYSDDGFSGDEHSDDEYSDDEYSDDEYSDDVYSDDVYSDEVYSDDDSELNIEGHNSDHIFTDDELDFIEADWRNSDYFMVFNSLDIDKNEDCEVAKSLVQALMSLSRA